jgi:ribonuclease HII
MTNNDFENMSVASIREEVMEMEPTEALVAELMQEPRKGVNRIGEQVQRRIEAKKLLESRYVEMSSYEMRTFAKGFTCIAGIDEVGRGPLSGPVYAAAVVLDPDKPILGLDDSKRLSEKQRLNLYKQIREKAVAIGVGSIDNERIDEINILNAAKEAMAIAVESMDASPDYLLIDAVKLQLDIPQDNIIKGDQKSNSIAAASIIAKVERDYLMVQMAQKYPGYDFENNKGYGTAKHYQGIEKIGITPIHRMTFLKNLKER